MHAQRGHAQFLVEDKQAHFVFTVKKNQPSLYERLRMLPWDQVTVTHHDRGAGHGCKETRVLKALSVDDLDFPHVHQVARLTRHSTRIKTGRQTRETVYLITSLTSRQASPDRLQRLVRSQWIIGRVAPALCGAGAPSEPGERAFPAPRLKQARRRRG